MPIGFVYILECSDGSFYTGSTINLELRIQQHKRGLGANHTKKRLPVKLLYFEQFERIDHAFNREKKLQGWSRNKKLALINQNYCDLARFSVCMNESHYKNHVASAPLSHQETAPLNHPETAPISHQETAPISHQETAPLNQNEPNPISHQQRNNPNKLTLRSKTFYSNGKLLITGEYVVLDGALSLAIPTKLGQSLKVELIDEPKIKWKSLDEKHEIWFEDEFSIEENIVHSSMSDNEISNRLIQILKEAKHLNLKFLADTQGFKITTSLEFPINWGLGTSSTLINNIANWAGADAYKLLAKTFRGSGYDIACAQHDHPITYQLISCTPNVKEVDFNPSFKEHLYFVYLNKKQNSRDGIAHYKSNRSNISKEISAINNITLKMIDYDNLNDFQQLMESHEDIIASIINQKPVKELLFSDFKGSIKSLGAWGGDFVMVASKEDPTDYFKSKGFDTIIPYQILIK